VAITFGRGIWETPLYTATGINQLSVNNNSIKLYPNPNNGNFILRMQNVTQKSQLQIFNVLGEEIYSATLNSTTTPINLSSHVAGLYLYRVLDEQGDPVSEGKFVIE
jgi:hypothetical protein